VALTITRLAAQTFNTLTGTKTNAGTPGVGSLLLIVSVQTGLITSTPPTDDQGGTYTRAADVTKNITADLMQLWVRDQLTAGAVLHTVTHAQGATTGGGLVVLEVTGMKRAGHAAIRQMAVVSGTGSAPAPTFPAAVLTANGVVGAVFNAANPATMTEPTGFTEVLDDGYNTPPTGIEVVRANSGITATTITWGSSSASAFGSLVAELNIAPPSPWYYEQMIGGPY
jgi:hypothetical protein